MLFTRDICLQGHLGRHDATTGCYTLCFAFVCVPAYIVQLLVNTSNYDILFIMSIIKLFTCSLGVQLSFTLLNSDPASLHTEWNIEQAIHSRQ